MSIDFHLSLYHAGLMVSIDFHLSLDTGGLYRLKLDPWRPTTTYRLLVEGQVLALNSEGVGAFMASSPGACIGALSFRFCFRRQGKRKARKGAATGMLGYMACSVTSVCRAYSWVGW
jgi:hypothetical protein